MRNIGVKPGIIDRIIHGSEPQEGCKQCGIGFTLSSIRESLIDTFPDEAEAILDRMGEIAADNEYRMVEEDNFLLPSPSTVLRQAIEEVLASSKETETQVAV